MSCMSLQTHPQQTHGSKIIPISTGGFHVGFHHFRENTTGVTGRTRWEEKFTEILQILEFCTLESNYQTNLSGDGHRRENPSCRYQYGVYPDIPILFLRNVWCVPGGWIAGVLFFSMNITNFGTSDTEDCKCVTVRFDSLIHCMDKSWTNVHDCDVFDCNQKLVPRFFFVDFCWLNLLRNCPRKCHSIPYYQQSV